MEADSKPTCFCCNFIEEGLGGAVGGGIMSGPFPPKTRFWIIFVWRMSRWNYMAVLNPPLLTYIPEHKAFVSDMTFKCHLLKLSIFFHFIVTLRGRGFRLFSAIWPAKFQAINNRMDFLRPIHIKLYHSWSFWQFIHNTLLLEMQFVYVDCKLLDTLPTDTRG